MGGLQKFLEVDDRIRAFRDRRARLVRQGLERLRFEHSVVTGTRLTDFALANELAAYIREEAGKAGFSQQELMASARDRFERGVAALVDVGPLVAIRALGLDEDQCMFTDGVTLESLIPEESALLGEAVQVLDSVDVLTSIEQSVGIVIVLGLVKPGAPVATWATGRLPYAVHLHLMPRAELIARDLIHEATHTHLNDWLGSRDVRLDSSTPRFWSPWKDSERPLFGFVHSIVAFSVVTTFLNGVMANRHADWAWLRPFHKAEQERLRGCEASVKLALSELPQDLAVRVSDVYAWAVS